MARAGQDRGRGPGGTRVWPPRRPLAGLLAWALLAACGGTGGGGNASFQVRESVRQVQVTHAQPGVMLELVDASGAVVQSGVADALGSFLFRKVAPGGGYVVRAAAEHSRGLEVRSAEDSLPPTSFYSGQRLAEGFGYLTTRDGTTLSVFVSLPGPVEMGPYPTLVDYSGYSPSRPDTPLSQYEFLCGEFPVLCAPPSDPAGLLGGLNGYATVSVNIRGTGCSGGAYDFFEELEVLDGYDVIEIVAAQPWAAGHRVGMAGISYPGISQLFVAAAQPPSLAAISPLSVIGNPASTLLPGGILNDGFGLEWVSEVVGKADPYGQGWERGRADGGDATCAENQLLHGQKVDNVKQIFDRPFYDPATDDRLNPVRFVDRIAVPVFLAGAWQDEQTGPGFAELLARFAPTRGTRITAYNGLHPDGFAPAVYAEWRAFLDLYVAGRKPGFTAGQRQLAPIIFDDVFATPMTLPPDRWGGASSLEAARAQWEGEPRFRALFESGGGTQGAALGAPQAGFEWAFDAWPPGEPVRLYLHAGGGLGAAAPVEVAAASRFELDPAAGERGNQEDGADPWALLPRWDWRPLAPGKAIAFETDALDEDTLLLGPASADLWLRAGADDADLQVTISEVRPDGAERFVQSGWVRASYRALAPSSTAAQAVLTLGAGDIAKLAPGVWTPVRVPVPAAGHPFRRGSRIRVVIDTPGGTRTRWRFRLQTFPGAGPVHHDIGHDAAHPSSVVLTLVKGAPIPGPLPACPSLRGQPCRPYQRLVNPPSP